MAEDDSSVQRDVTLPAEADEVWQALTTEEGLEEWLAAEVDMDLREGGELLLRYHGGEERHGVVEEIEEERRLVFRWRREYEEESRVEFLLETVPAGTRLVVVETGGPTMRAAAWSGPLTALRARQLTPMLAEAR